MLGNVSAKMKLSYDSSSWSNLRLSRKCEPHHNIFRSQVSMRLRDRVLITLLRTESSRKHTYLGMSCVGEVIVPHSSFDKLPICIENSCICCSVPQKQAYVSHCLYAWGSLIEEHLCIDCFIILEESLLESMQQSRTIVFKGIGWVNNRLVQWGMVGDGECEILEITGSIHFIIRKPRCTM